MNIGIDQDLIDSLKGFLDVDEGMGLYEFALKAGSLGPCLEIGSYCGRSTVYLAAGCQKNNSILFSIDHHRGSEEQQPGEQYFDPELFNPQTGYVDTFSEFRKTLRRAELEDAVVPIVCSSALAARKWTTPLSLVFIDGGHSFESAYTDYNAWVGHIIPGGFLLIHDIFPDPAEGGRAPYQIYNLAVASGLFQEVTMIKTLGVLKRREVHNVPDDILNL
jgi:predicted O-methyltransferase YrrM